MQILDSGSAWNIQSFGNIYNTVIFDIFYEKFSKNISLTATYLLTIIKNVWI
jgi:hypothetical protein